MFARRASTTYLVFAAALIAFAWFGRANAGRPAAAQATRFQIVLVGCD